MLFFSESAYIEEVIATNSTVLVMWAFLALGLLTIISLKTKKLTALGKKLLFGSIVLVTLLPTLYLIVSTIQLNVISQSGGPVHWHADFEIWQCGQKLDLKDPTGFSNKIGTATFHEHNDDRMHVEGVVVESSDVNLERFFTVIDGKLTAETLTLPTTHGEVLMRNGDTCRDGTPGTLQVFVYQTDDDNYYTQQKLSDLGSYLLSPKSTVPSGDCIIVEFGEVKNRTDKLCRSYQAAEEIGKLKGERK
ncbi:MAG: hypothetical protein AAB553_07150 [Patescibacteria group bacterium]